MKPLLLMEKELNSLKKSHKEILEEREKAEKRLESVTGELKMLDLQIEDFYKAIEKLKS